MPRNHQEAVASYLTELGLEQSRVAFEDTGLAIDVRAIPGDGFSFVGARHLMRDIRMVKTPEEVAHIRSASRKTELALQIRPGPLYLAMINI